MKAKFGAIVVAGSGKVGGHVFSKNRGGAYMRTKVTPANPNTVAQQNVRSILGSLSQSWSGLTDSQRLAWNNAVSDWTTTDIFGDIKNPSGINLYVRLNSNLLNVNESPILVPPVKLEMPFTPLTGATYSVATDTLQFEPQGGEYATLIMAIDVTPVLSAGVSFVKSEFRRLGYATQAASTISLAGYAAKFGAPAIGANIRAQIYPVLATGQKGSPQGVKVTVIA